MENKKKELITWAVEEFKNRLVLGEQRWSFFPKQPFYDYRSSLILNHKTYEGRGVSSSQKQAVTACIAEALERFAIDFQGNRHSSTGCAAHSDKQLGKVNSRRELIERHFVMLFTLGYTNQEIVNSNILRENFISATSSLKMKNIDVRFYQLHSTSKDVVTLCSISGLNAFPKFGLTFGACCRSSLEESLEGSFLEALPNVMAYLNGGISSISLSDFKKIISPKPEDHLALYFDRDFALYYVQNRNSSELEFPGFNDEFFYTEEIKYPYSDFLPVFRSTHPHLLDAKWGMLPANLEPLNLNPDFPFVLA